LYGRYLSSTMSDMFGLFDSLTLVADVSNHDGRSLESLLAPQALGGGNESIGGAIIEASYVQRDPPLLARLGESHIPWAINPQSVRFASPRYRNVSTLAKLPYAPDRPLDPARFDDETRKMVRGALEFQAAHEPSMYLVPTLPTTKASKKIFRAFHELHAFASDLNGSPTIPYRPMLAASYPSYAVMRSRFGTFDRLDRPFAGAFVQPLLLNTRHDSVEKLVAYSRFLQTVSEGPLPVVAGRPGPFGLVLAAFGIELFESSLDGGGSYSSSRLDREPKQIDEGKRTGGRSRSVYVGALRTSLPFDTAAELMTSLSLSAQLACLLGECRTGGFPFALEEPRRHFFHVRQDELKTLRKLPTPEYRVPVVMGWLRSAADLGRAINRIREEQNKGPIDFGHLDRWIGVLARVGAASALEDQV
jgi:hypothetical protein